jgi:cobalt-zinc-cadmium efflux system protein
MHSDDGLDRALKKRLKLSIALTGVIFLVEFIGGYYTNSLALMSDAAHVFMDVLALSLSFFALHISGLPPDEKRTFGLHRAEVLVAFVNGLMLLFMTGFIFYKAAGRLSSPLPVESTGMLIVAAVGFVVNLMVGVWLMRFAATDLNIRSAFLHVMGDAAASVGVIIGAIIIAYTGWNVVDPLISIAIGCVIIAGSVRIMRESGHILLEGVPREVDLNRVLDDIKAVDGVTSVHSLHIWSICHNVYALSAHLEIGAGKGASISGIYNEINEKLAEAHHIFYTTLQAQCTGCDLNGVFRRLDHTERGLGHHNH